MFNKSVYYWSYKDMSPSNSTRLWKFSLWESWWTEERFGCQETCSSYEQLLLRATEQVSLMTFGNTSCITLTLQQMDWVYIMIEGSVRTSACTICIFIKPKMSKLFSLVRYKERSYGDSHHFLFMAKYNNNPRKQKQTLHSQPAQIKLSDCNFIGGYQCAI